MKFEKHHLEIWAPYILEYFLDILNCDYKLEDAIEDLEKLVGDL